MRSSELRAALDLLEMSRVVSLVRHSSANGVPLGAEVSDGQFKPLLLDIGLCNNLCGLDLPDAGALATVQEGRLAEQFVGQELLALGPGFEERSLYYWHREAKNANAEVDYLWALGDRIVPVEVRAGTSGSLKSLHVFLGEKRRDLAVRFNMDRPSVGSFTTPTTTAFTLVSLPLSLAGQLQRLLLEHFDAHAA
jgi:predicted AAA+ superfamily ATPase